MVILNCESYFKGSVNNKDQDGNTKLHIASRQGHLENVEMLLELGVSLKKINKIQRTALHEAALNGHFEIAKLLLQNGADVDAKDKIQKTPLQFAAQRGVLLFY